jgi:hypothetical protein
VHRRDSGSSPVCRSTGIAVLPLRRRREHARDGGGDRIQVAWHTALPRHDRETTDGHCDLRCALAEVIEVVLSVVQCQLGRDRSAVSLEPAALDVVGGTARIATLPDDTVVVAGVDGDDRQ